MLIVCRLLYIFWILNSVSFCFLFSFMHMRRNENLNISYWRFAKKSSSQRSTMDQMAVMTSLTWFDPIMVWSLKKNRRLLKTARCFQTPKVISAVHPRANVASVLKIVCLKWFTTLTFQGAWFSLCSFYWRVAALDARKSRIITAEKTKNSSRGYLQKKTYLLFLAEK